MGTTSAQSEEPRCYNCSPFGHYQSQCPKPKRAMGSCFKCGELGHLYQTCPKRGLVAAVNNPEQRSTCDEEEAELVRAVRELQTSEKFY
ncbi:PREDICTED: cellular nucleic acid-binding protein homolog [Rhagoletis zephyria]|uniref:cellular nucleic acid-binding protein homolog n=1 Tax=Rhagoletis zephyria TaxID=28612 RepID=UPI0008117A20|nr:PREDICTED: cellular nucleic acid-binding protein homolog [Rhagoletis zephyria]